MIQGAARYARSRTETASPPQVLVLLLRAARASMGRAVQELQAGRREQARHDLDKAHQIVCELHGSLDHRHAPELSGKLSATYEFVLGRLLLASTGRGAAPVEEALRAFTPIADAFEQVISQGASR